MANISKKELAGLVRQTILKKLWISLANMEDDEMDSLSLSQKFFMSKIEIAYKKLTSFPLDRAEIKASPLLKATIYGKEKDCMNLCIFDAMKETLESLKMESHVYDNLDDVDWESGDNPIVVHKILETGEISISIPILCYSKEIEDGESVLIILQNEVNGKYPDSQLDKQHSHPREGSGSRFFRLAESDGDNSLAELHKKLGKVQ